MAFFKADMHLTEFGRTDFSLPDGRENSI